MKAPAFCQVSCLFAASEQDRGCLRSGLGCFPCSETVSWQRPWLGASQSGADSQRKSPGWFASSKNSLALSTTHVCLQILVSRKPTMWTGSEFLNYLRNDTSNMTCPVGLIKCSWVAKTSLLKSPNLTMIQSIGFLGELLGCLLKLTALKISWILLDTVICKPDVILSESFVLRGTEY